MFNHGLLAVSIILMSKPPSMPLIKLFLFPILVLFGLGSSSNVENKEPVTSTEPVLKQEFFKYLRCHRQAKNIVVNWGTTSVAGVDHFIVYHSELGDFFDPIEEIYPNGDLKYSFKHELVFPGYHYYYIAAVMDAGPPVNSVVDVVRIVGH